MLRKDKKKGRCEPRVRKFSENCGGLRRRADKERARLIEKICKAGGASPRHRLIRIRVSFRLMVSVKGGWMPSGSHRETGKRERERAQAGKHRQKETAREREWHCERGIGVGT